MSQLVQPKLTLPGQIRSSQWLAPLVIVLAAAALMAFALIDGNDKPANVAVDQPQSLEQALRPGGGPEETSVATSVAPRPTPASPVESRIAAAVAAGSAEAPSFSSDHKRIPVVPVGPLGR
jgi:hypothetical protein